MKYGLRVGFVIVDVCVIGVAVALIVFRRDPVPSPAASPLTPLIMIPSGEVIKGNKDMADALPLLEIMSGQAVESPIEERLAIIDFSPDLVMRHVLRQDRCPDKLETFLKKQQRWWPYFRNRKLHKNGGPDAVVSRFSMGGYAIQIVESRAQSVFFARKEDGKLDMKASTVAGGIPMAFIDVFQANIFKNTQPQVKDEATFTDGTTMHIWYIDRLDALSSLPGGPPTADLRWTDQFIVLSLSWPYSQAGTPGIMLRKPLFAPPQR